MKSHPAGCCKEIPTTFVIVSLCSIRLGGQLKWIPGTRESPTPPSQILDPGSRPGMTKRGLKTGKGTRNGITPPDSQRHRRETSLKYRFNFRETSPTHQRNRPPIEWIYKFTSAVEFRPSKKEESKCLPHSRPAKSRQP